METYAENVHQKLVPDLFQILFIITKYSQCIQGTICR